MGDKRGRILIAENEEGLRSFYIRVLNTIPSIKSQYDIVEADTIAVAKARYDSGESVSLFILDNNTDDGGILGLDWSEALKGKRKDIEGREAPYTPILLIADLGTRVGYVERAEHLERERVSVDFRYLPKPVSIADLKAAVNAVLF